MQSELPRINNDDWVVSLVPLTQKTPRDTPRSAVEWAHGHQSRFEPRTSKWQVTSYTTKSTDVTPDRGLEAFPPEHVHFSAVATYHFAMLSDLKIKVIGN